MIFTTKNNELAIFGKTIDDVRNKLIDFNDVIMQGGSFGEKTKSKLIPYSQMFTELSNNDAKKIVDTLNSIKEGTNQAFTSMDDYLSYLEREGKGYIKNYVKENQNQVYVTDDVIAASKKARAEQIAYNTTIQQSTIAFKAASVAKRIFATIGNMAAMWAISKAISVVTDTIGELVHSEENLRQSASELGSELSNNSSDIEGYKKKIEELKTVINDSSSSFGEVSQARIDLMAIQDELIEKFGTEKGVIESITSAINDQTDALDELSKRAYFQAKNKFNEKTGGDKVADWLSFGNTSDNRIQSNMDKMVSAMRYSFFELETTGNEVLDNLIAKSYNLNIVEDMYGYGKHFQVYGTLDEIQDKLYGIQELSQDFDISTGFENSFTQISNDVDDALAKYKNLYDQYVLYEKILTDNPDNQYDEQFDLINKAKEAFNEASKLGDSKKIKATSDEYAQTLQSAIDLAMQNSDFDVADYFKSMYPELQQMFGKWQFNIDFKPNTNGLKDKVANALDSIDGVSDGTTLFSVEDIENFNPNIATQEQINAYGELTNVAESYGLTIKQLISLLQILGLVQSESYQQLVDTFGQENVDKLSPEDLQIAYTIENAGNMTFEELQAEIERQKELFKEPVSLSISETITQLNTLLKSAFDSLQSAYQDISDDGKFQLSSIDILSTCDSIKSKLDELNKIDGITVDYSAFEDFVKVLSNTESIEQNVETAFNSLATSITQAALSGTEDFGTMKAALEDLGVINSEIVAFGALISNTEALKEAGLDLVTVSQMEESEADAKITEFANEAVSAENLEQAISLLKIQKILCNENWINSTDDINNLLTLANAAGIASDALGQLYNLKAQYDAADNSHAKAAIAAQMEALKSTVQAEFANVQIDFGAVGGGKSASKTAKETQKEVDIMAELNSEMDKLQSAYKSLCDIRDTYNKYGKITVDQYQELTNMGFGFLANLVDENGQLGLNEQAFEALANAKLQEMQIQLARNAIDTINGIKNETEATEYLTYANENLRNAALSSTEALLYQAQAMAHLRGEQQGLAADQIVQGYEASKQLVEKVEFGFDPSEMDKAAEDAKKASEDAKQAYMDAYNEEKKLLDHMRAMDEISNSEYYERLMKLAEKYFGGKEEYRDNLWEVQEEYHDHLESIKETYNWIENLLESLSKKTNALIDKASKFISWQKKNAMINRAVKASDKEITQNQNAYQYYMKKADGIGLSRSYINKIQNAHYL